jgi:hypothetical protein
MSTRGKDTQAETVSFTKSTSLLNNKARAKPIAKASGTGGQDA